jgi:hypothetical protein
VRALGFATANLHVTWGAREAGEGGEGNCLNPFFSSQPSRPSRDKFPKLTGVEMGLFLHRQ